jgi:beta-lactam-binding protein with PASTA domain
VPNLSGLDRAAATAALRAAGLQVGSVVPVRQSDLPPGVNINTVQVGQVILQSPVWGVSVPTGSFINIAIRAE